MTTEIVLFVVLLIFLIGLMVYFRRQESKYLHKKTSQTFSPSLKEEIDQERNANLEKKRKFEEALKKAGGL